MPHLNSSRISRALRATSGSGLLRASSRAGSAAAPAARRNALASLRAWNLVLPRLGTAWEMSSAVGSAARADPTRTREQSTPCSQNDFMIASEDGRRGAASRAGLPPLGNSVLAPAMVAGRGGRQQENLLT